MLITNDFIDFRFCVRDGAHHWRGAFKAVVDSQVLMSDRILRHFDASQMTYLGKRRGRDDDSEDRMTRALTQPDCGKDARGGVVIILTENNDARPDQPTWFIIPDAEFCTNVKRVAKQFKLGVGSPYRIFWWLRHIKCASAGSDSDSLSDEDDIVTVEAAFGLLFQGKWQKYKQPAGHMAVYNAKFTCVMLCK